MSTALNVLLIIALLATLLALVLGFVGMFKKDDSKREENSNRMMRLRIIFQSVALIVLAILLFMSRG